MGGKKLFCFFMNFVFSKQKKMLLFLFKIYTIMKNDNPLKLLKSVVGKQQAQLQASTSGWLVPIQRPSNLH